MQSKTWTIGKVKIIQIIEIEAGDVIQETIPKAKHEEIQKIKWLVPDFANEDGSLKALVQSFVIDTDKKKILVDTCVGNDKTRTDIEAWSNLQEDFLGRLQRTGYNPEDIDIVLCTHLHFDHVGWNTKLIDGEWVPTFTNARYLFSEEEYNYWLRKPEKEIADDHAGFNDSVVPIMEAGLADLVINDHQVCQEVRLIPTPGHTPAHVSVLVESDDEKAVITGDVMHHPCQLHHSDWETVADTDPDKATDTRRKFLSKYKNTKTLVIGSHFSLPTAGYIVEKDKEIRLTKNL